MSRDLLKMSTAPVTSLQLSSSCPSSIRRHHPRAPPTEARRAQNRAAQKIYRAKQKLRLTQLEALISTPDQQSLSDLTPVRSFSLGLVSQNMEARREPDLIQWPEILPTQPPDSEAIDLQTQAHNLESSVSWPEMITSSDCLTMLDTTSFTLSNIIKVGIEALSTKTNVTEPPSCQPQSSLFNKEQFQLNPSEAALPCPYINNIHIARLSFVSACLANAPAIGVPLSQCCGSSRESPFYLPSTSSSSVSASLINNTISTFCFLPPDLRPRPAQITTSHCVYIDLLPFSYFRERVLGMLACAPPDGFDEADLCRDLDAGGLVCWGASHCESGGVPWDRRSWEAKGWFLRKWWLLTGGIDGDMYKQSWWWCKMRGEKFEG